MNKHKKFYIMFNFPKYHIQRIDNSCIFESKLGL